MHQFGLRPDLLHASGCFGYRAVALGGLGLLQKQFLVDAWNLGFCAQVDAAYGVDEEDDEGRVTVRVTYAIASREVSSATSSVRNLAKALAVLLLTVPRGVEIRSDISL